MEPGFQLEYQRYLKEVSDLLNADEGFQGAIKNSGPNAQVFKDLYYKWIALYTWSCSYLGLGVTAKISGREGSDLVHN